MRAVVYDTYGGPEVLKVNDVPEPHADSGQVRIKVRAASINPMDCKLRAGQLADGQPAEGLTVAGLDGAGVIDEVGDGVTGVAVGDEVVGVGQGVQAEYAVLTAWAAKPEDMSWTESGALGVIGETAARGLTLLGIGKGDTIFIDGASGSVGKVAVQLAVARGAGVIGSASAGKQEQVAALGAEPVVYGDGLGSRVRALAEKVDGVFDTTGKTPVDELIALVDAPHDVVTIVNFGATDTGIRASVSTSDPDPLASLAEVVGLCREGKLRVEVDDTFPFEGADKGHRATEAGTTKIVLVP